MPPPHRLPLLLLALLAPSPLALAREKMPESLLRSATRERFVAVMEAHMPDVRTHLLSAAGEEPQQLHLAPTTDPSVMAVSWVTGSPVEDPTVLWWPGAAGTPMPASPSSAAALRGTYTAGVTGWTGSVYTSNMSSLTPSSPYSYVVGSPALNLWSMPTAFRAQPTPGAGVSVKLAISADQGTIVPMGWAVAAAELEEHTQSGAPFDAVLLSGDISYATVDPPNGEVEWTWDSYMLQMEPLVSTVPFIVTVGNHEATPGNVTLPGATSQLTDVWGAAFTARFQMPGNGNGNLWFSVNVGPVHIASISSEHPYQPGTPQSDWLVADLAAVDRATTPWVFVSLHRPVYSSDSDEYGSHCPGGTYPAALEAIFVKAKVDLVLQGHEHCAERTYAHINGTVVTRPVNQGNGTAANTYVNPGAPIYILQGSSGAMQEEAWVTPAPAWSAFRTDGEDVWGYGIMNVRGANLLEYEFVDTNRVVQDAWRIVRQ
jgi:hypothetical protein